MPLQVNVLIKILHSADIHLDCPFVTKDPKEAYKRREEQRKSFGALMSYAKENQVDFVLIPGDLFDRNFVTKDTLDLVKESFESNPECNFVITPGNHDYYSPDSMWNKMELPANVHLFKSPILENVSFDLSSHGKERVNIYGYAFTSAVMTKNPFAGTIVEDTEAINILLAHGDMLSANSNNCPISEDDIQSTNFDYVALGHIHNPLKGIVCEEGVWYGYSGCLEPKNFGDRDYKGAIYIEAEKKEQHLKLRHSFVRFSDKRYMVEELNVSGAQSEDDIRVAFAEMMSKKRYSNDTLLRVDLVGNIPPTLEVSPGRLLNAFEKEVFYLEVNNKTLPLLDYEALSHDPTIKGAFFNALLPMLKSENSEERERAALALRYGLDALNGNDVIDF